MFQTSFFPCFLFILVLRRRDCTQLTAVALRSPRPERYFALARSEDPPLRSGPHIKVRWQSWSVVNWVGKQHGHEDTVSTVGLGEFDISDQYALCCFFLLLLSILCGPTDHYIVIISSLRDLFLCCDLWIVFFYNYHYLLIF